MTREDLLNLIAKRLGFSSYDSMMNYYTDSMWEHDGLDASDSAEDIVTVLETLEVGDDYDTSGY